MAKPLIDPKALYEAFRTQFTTRLATVGATVKVGEKEYSAVVKPGKALWHFHFAEDLHLKPNDAISADGKKFHVTFAHTEVKGSGVIYYDVTAQLVSEKSSAASQAK